MADVTGCDVVLTCGGTGFGPATSRPKATLDVCDRVAPGIAEHIRAESGKVTRPRDALAARRRR